MMDLKEAILESMKNGPLHKVWSANDFVDLGNRHAIDKALQRLVKSKQVRRIDRGLYDRPIINNLTGKLGAPDYREIIEAVARRNQVRILIDGLTAANDLGLTNAVPGQIVILTDGRLQPIKIQNLIIRFKHTAPSKLFWAGRPAVRIVQALHWLRDILNSSEQTERNSIQKKLTIYFRNSDKKNSLLTDLHEGLHTLPIWMQVFLKELFTFIESDL